ncbi:hypothetical protein Xmir_04165 [Xenorhabdus miraniensis]|uniref:Uncharacterized protein n=1 Tax=Xenorhabdus miraniensis TaxID=351674 RepID=A0A2D0JJT2_9GAMM|nr:hypothetical protein Xmir_04165 [Xenorhabdus miraniensis]
MYSIYAQTGDKTIGEACVVDMLTQQLRILKNDSTYYYFCMVFLNGVAVKHRYQIQTLDDEREIACLSRYTIINDKNQKNS